VKQIVRLDSRAGRAGQGSQIWNSQYVPRAFARVRIADPPSQNWGDRVKRDPARFSRSNAISKTEARFPWTWMF
jgi:hypothetical protein